MIKCNKLVCLQLPSFWPTRHFPQSYQADQGADGEAEEHQEEALRKLQRDTQLLLKEALERSRGWKEHPAPVDVELAFKKVYGEFFTENIKMEKSRSDTTPPCGDF